MRIGIDMNYTQNAAVYEGIGNYSFSLLTHLLDHPDVQLFYFQPKYSELGRDDFKSALSRFIIENELDIFHFSSPMEIPFAEVLLFEKLPKVRFTAVVFDIIPALYPDIYLQSPEVKYRYFLQLLMLQKLDHLLTISDFTRNDLIRFGFAPDTITSIGVGCEDFFILPESEPHPIEYLPKNKPYVLAFSPADFRKNAERLILAFAQMVKRANDNELQLVFANHIPEHIREQMNSISSDYGLIDRIHFVGRVTKSQLLQLYNRAFGVAFPSLYEGVGLPVLEAMQCGVPVLTSNVTSMPEVAGDAAILVNPQDVNSITEGLEALCFDSDLRAKLKARGSIHVEQFKWDLVAQRAVAEFRKLTAKVPHIKRDEVMRDRILTDLKYLDSIEKKIKKLYTRVGKTFRKRRLKKVKKRIKNGRKNSRRTR